MSAEEPSLKEQSILKMIMVADDNRVIQITIDFIISFLDWNLIIKTLHSELS